MLNLLNNMSKYYLKATDITINKIRKIRCNLQKTKGKEIRMDR